MMGNEDTQLFVTAVKKAIETCAPRQIGNMAALPQWKITITTKCEQIVRGKENICGSSGAHLGSGYDRVRRAVYIPSSLI